MAPTNLANEAIIKVCTPNEIDRVNPSRPRSYRIQITRISLDGQLTPSEKDQVTWSAP